jgi:hypothetical protein
MDFRAVYHMTRDRHRDSEHMGRNRDAQIGLFATQKILLSEMRADYSLENLIWTQIL